MTWLTAEWSDGRADLDPARAHIVGRLATADVHVEHPAVSRHHGDLVYGVDGWRFSDRSSNGSYIGEHRVVDHLVTEPTHIRLGSQANAPMLHLIPVVDHALGAPVRAPEIEIPSRVATVAETDEALRLDLDGRQLILHPGMTAVIGRSSECDLRTDDVLVSGRHCAVDHDGKRWVLRDLESTRGTFVDGRRINKPVALAGAMNIGLGATDAGPVLRAVTAGTHRPIAQKQRRLAVLGVLAAAIACIVAAIVFWPDSSSDAPNTGEQLARAKSATVFISTASEDGSFATGSGAFVTPTLVLTNRHVAEGWDSILLAIADTEDTPVQFRFEAVHLTSHPYLDVALLEIIDTVRFVDGQLAPSPLPARATATLGLGSSQDLVVGDSIHSLGFPSITSTQGVGVEGDFLLPAVTVSRGDIVTFSLHPGCDNPDADNLLVSGGFSLCAPNGDLPRGDMLSSDLSGSGGSGGPIVVDGVIVGIRYAAGPPVLASDGGAISTGGVALSVPIEYFGEWLVGEITRAG